MASANIFHRLPQPPRTYIQRSLSAASPAPCRNVLYEIDAEFQNIGQESLRRTETPDGGAKSAEKLYNTLQFIKAAARSGGSIAECGAFRGLFAYAFCRHQQLAKPGISGHGLSLFDSFEGLGAPTPEDEILERGGFIDGKFREKGAFEGGYRSFARHSRTFRMWHTTQVC